MQNDKKRRINSDGAGGKKKDNVKNESYAS